MQTTVLINSCSVAPTRDGRLANWMKSQDVAVLKADANNYGRDWFVVISQYLSDLIK